MRELIQHMYYCMVRKPCVHRSYTALWWPLYEVHDALLSGFVHKNLQQLKYIKDTFHHEQTVLRTLQVRQQVNRSYIT
ncbi:hypothetical protein EYF80_061076 [Liparis tanakae]|uniref:Uncharacterized protein n=1 Tax=Liparis tanakae TaxID=230148 RepID=A0A4Z2EIU0_9TELE|nr:hypothetical protein EYF80_061076 [Liparis tanakae]